MATTSIPDAPLRVAFAGATGVVGQQLAQRLRSAPQCAIWSWQRSGIEQASDQWHVIPFAEGTLPGPVDAFVSSLGTTLKRAGSKEAFHAIDVDAVLIRAAAARAQGAHNAVVVSSVGASETASSFYLRCKAEMEAGILGLGFDQVHVMRPSLLLGHRPESRPAEAVGQALIPLMAPALLGRLARYRPVTGHAVAEQMWACLHSTVPGRFAYHFDGHGWQASPL